MVSTLQSLNIDSQSCKTVHKIKNSSSLLKAISSLLKARQAIPDTETHILCVGTNYESSVHLFHQVKGTITVFSIP